jgi:hypothetical protein
MPERKRNLRMPEPPRPDFADSGELAGFLAAFGPVRGPVVHELLALCRMGKLDGVWIQGTGGLRIRYPSQDGGHLEGQARYLRWEYAEALIRSLRTARRASA